MRIFQLSAWAALLLLAGCAKPALEPPLYQLKDQALSTEAFRDTPVVVLESFTLADYLQGTHLVQRLSATSLANEAQGQWAAPLDQAVAEYMLEQLGFELKTHNLFSREVAKADARLLVSISRLDSGPEHDAVLTGHWSLLDAQAEPRKRRVVRLSEVHDGSLADQVRAQSDLLSAFAKLIAAQLQEELKQPAPVKPVVAPEPPLAPVQPKAKPARAVDVFRF